MNVSSRVTKPIRSSKLLAAILAAVTGASPEPVAAPTIAPLAPPMRPLRLLVAEDNAVNRKLICRLLEKCGHDVVVVNDGQEALEAVQTDQFDAVLMDIQMPVMDGLQATARIREQEAGGPSHLPIIALTAHAAQEDRQTFLASGMDAHVAKPIRQAELVGVLNDVAAGQPPDEPGPQAPGAPAPLDLPQALTITGGDESLLAELAELFLANSPLMASQIAHGLLDGDLEQVARAAHTLKGSASNFGAHPVVQAAADLETAAGVDNLESAQEQWTRLRAELSDLEAALAPLAGGNVACEC